MCVWGGGAGGVLSAERAGMDGLAREEDHTIAHIMAQSHHHGIPHNSTTKGVLL